jgi:hypothetical protein
VDGNREDRRGIVSVFNGRAPLIQTFDRQADEIGAVSAWLAKRNAQDVTPHEVGVFVRTEAELGVR